MRNLRACLALAWAASASRADPTAFTVRVDSGALQGRAYGDGAVFAGIPFAAPPVGPLRWREPQPPAPWPGVRDATLPSKDEVQPEEGWNHSMLATASEDCLYLNVVTPHWPQPGKTPVIVFVHGGGNVAGGGWEHLEKNITLQDRGVVVVTVNYRLGIFGFFSHPALTAESSHHASGNYALQDLVAALAWIRANIAQFGGDPNNVTMMGQSAGALDICLLMASPVARDLFQKAIVESTPGIGAPVTQNLREAEMHGLTFARDLGCPTLDALRGVAAPALLAGAERHRKPGGVVVDGWILEESPARTFAGGRESRIPIIIGTNARESSYDGTASGLRDLISARYGTLADRALDLYGAETSGQSVDPAFGDEGARFQTDTTFRSPSSLVAAWHSGAGAPVWLYLFNRTPKGRESVGAKHSSELAYAFGEMRNPPAGAEFGSEDARLSRQIGEYWANFARTGDPNSKENSVWPKYDGSRRAYLELRAGGSVSKDHLRQPFLELYRDYFISQMAEATSSEAPSARRN